MSGWWAGPGPAGAGLTGRLTQGERGQGAVGGQRREHTEEQPPERGGLRGSKNHCQWSWPPPFVHPRAHRARLPALLASPPPDGRTWRGGRSRGWARRAASGSTQRWPRAEPGPRPPGRAGAAAASPWSSHWPPPDCAPPPPASNPRERGVPAPSRRASPAPPGLPAQSPRRLGHASSSPNERCPRHWVLSVPPRAEALPVRREPISVENSAGPALRDSSSATPTRLVRIPPISSAPPVAPNGGRATAGGWEGTAAGRQQPRERSSASSSPLGPGRCGLPGSTARARPQTWGPAPGHRGTSLDRSAPRHAGRCSSRPAGDSPPQTYACRPPPGPFLSNPASA